MLTPGPYADAIWQLSLRAGGRTRGGVMCRVFSSEDELFHGTDLATEREAAGQDLVWLPVDLLPVWRAAESSPQRISQAPWTKDRPPYGMAQEVGVKLWSAMPDVAKRSVLDVDARQGRPLRLKIATNASALDDLPWEWLSDGGGPPFALRPDVRLVRSLPQLFAMPALSVRKPIRVVLVVANPKDERHLRTPEEVAAVRGRLVPPDFELDVVTMTTLDGLLERCHRSMPTVIHYIGHAGLRGDCGSLIFHDEGNASNWVNPATVAQGLPASVRLLCLSTCVTTDNYQILGLPHFAHAPKELALPTIVANQYPLGIESVRPFWDAFYDGLVAANGDVSEAVHRGRQAVAASTAGWADWGSFRLVLRDREGLAFRIAAEQTDTAFAAQIQAQFASRLANELADEVRTKGVHASAEMRESLNRATQTFTDISRDL